MQTTVAAGKLLWQAGKFHWNKASQKPAKLWQFCRLLDKGFARLPNVQTASGKLPASLLPIYRARLALWSALAGRLLGFATVVCCCLFWQSPIVAL